MSGWKVPGGSFPVGPADDGSSTQSITNANHAVNILATPDTNAPPAGSSIVVQTQPNGTNGAISARVDNSAGNESLLSMATNAAGFLKASAAFQMNGHPAILTLGEAAGAQSRIGFFGVAAVAQPAHPVTLADVIAALTALGLTA